MNWAEIVTIFVGTGFITTLSQIFLTDKLNKQFFRFSNLYKDKLDIIREFYMLLVKAEKGLNILMIELKPDLNYGKDGNPDEVSERKLAEFNMKTYVAINSFFDFYDQNEIIFEDGIVQLINQLREKFNKSENANSFAAMMETSRGSKAWENAIEKKIDAHELYVVKEIPEIKNKLRIFFQKQYEILKAN